MLQNTSNTDGAYTGIWSQDADNDATNAGIIFKNVSQSGSNASMHFLTRPSGAGAQEVMTIDINGNVGIGTQVTHASLNIHEPNAAPGIGTIANSQLHLYNGTIVNDHSTLSFGYSNTNKSKSQKPHELIIYAIGLPVALSLTNSLNLLKLL